MFVAASMISKIIQVILTKVVYLREGARRAGSKTHRKSRFRNLLQ